MITLGTKSWGSSPTNSITFYYEKKRSGADMMYRVQASVAPCTGSSYFGYPIYMKLYIAGSLRCTVTLKGASPTQWSSAITYTSAWYTVPNKADGTTAVSFNIYSGSGSSRDETYSFSMAVDPGKSTMSVGNGTLGVAQTMAITRLSSSFTHTITYTCGSASGTICDKSSSTSISWTPPLDLAKQNTVGDKVTVSLTLTTYSGSTSVGSNSYTITYNIPSSVKPTLSSGWATVAPYNVGSVAASINAYVQGYSKAQVTFNSGKINMATAYGATISSYKIVMGSFSTTTAPYVTPFLPTAGNVSITCYVYDSRGRYAYETLTIAVQEYSMPTLKDISVYRSNSAGVADDTGTYITVKATSVISSIAGLNRGNLRARVKVSGGEYGAYTALTSGTAAVLGGGLISTQSTYVVEISLIDQLNRGAMNTSYIPTGSVFFMGMEGGNGAAFGKYPEYDNMLDVEWDLRTRGDLYIGSSGNKVADFVIEEGATYSDSGLWEYRKWNDGRIEMWSRQSIDSGAFNGENGFYYSNVISLPIPFRLGSDKSVATVSVHSSGITWAATAGAWAEEVRFTVGRLYGGTNSLSLAVQVYVSGYPA